MQWSLRKGILKDLRLTESDENPLHVLRGDIMLPLKSSCATYVTISYIEQLYQDRATKIGPSILLSPVLPKDAEVFCAVRNGNLDALKRLLVDRKATLSTRDQDGRCLLNVCSLQYILPLGNLNYISTLLATRGLKSASF